VLTSVTRSHHSAQDPCPCQITRSHAATVASRASVPIRRRPRRLDLHSGQPEARIARTAARPASRGSSGIGGGWPCTGRTCRRERSCRGRRDDGEVSRPCGRRAACAACSARRRSLRWARRRVAQVGSAWKARYRYDDPSTSSSVFSKGTIRKSPAPHYVRIRHGF